MKESDIAIDIERCAVTIKEAGTPDVSSDHSISIPLSVDELTNGEKSLSPSNIVCGVSPDLCKNSTKKEKRCYSMSAKKPPKPPRPPRGLSLDAADQKLIKELSELAMIKRARIERMKALKRVRAAKMASSSVSNSSSGNVFAMLFTFLFCIVIIFQGCHPFSGFLPRNSPANSNEAIKGDIFVLHDQMINLPTNSMPFSTVGSPNIMEPVRASDNTDDGRKAKD